MLKLVELFSPFALMLVIYGRCVAVVVVGKMDYEMMFVRTNSIYIPFITHMPLY